MSLTFWRTDNGDKIVSNDDPLPVTIANPSDGRLLTVREMLERGADITGILTGEGRAFYASDADQNDLVTGQTSFADTTPTFTLSVPQGTVAIPILVSLGQTGTVAGDTISVIMELTKPGQTRFSSGTAETSQNIGKDKRVAKATLYSTVTAVAGYGVRVWGVNVAQDVAPAEGISNELIWSPSGPDFIYGPGEAHIYTYAGTTGPTWFWTIKWLEVPVERMGF